MTFRQGLVNSSYLLLLSSSPFAQQVEEGIDAEALISQILLVDKAQRDRIQDLVMDAELIEGERDVDKQSDKVRFLKKVYIKYLPDTALYYEEYLQYFKNDELRSEEELAREAGERIEQRRKRNTRNAAFPMLKPFYPENRGKYEIFYRGVALEQVADHVCHRFTVTAIAEEPDAINGDYYFQAESFHLVHVDFSPARLTKKMMFRLSKLNMSITYQPVLDDLWLPSQFEIEGKGRAAFFIGVNFAAVEYYRDHQVNVGLDAAMFEVEHGD